MMQCRATRRSHHFEHKIRCYLADTSVDAMWTDWRRQTRWSAARSSNTVNLQSPCSHVPFPNKQNSNVLRVSCFQMKGTTSLFSVMSV